jgi:hypothetical protein
MKSLSSIALALLALVLAAPALAGDDAPPPAAPAGPPPPTPSADEIKKVTEYFLRGKDVGPVLMDFVPCKKTGKSAEGKLVCEEKLEGKAKKGDALIAYVRFFVPKAAKYEDLKIKFMLNGEVRSTLDFTVSEAWTGYANYKQTTASKAGTWEMQVLRGENILAKSSVIVE